MDKFENKEKKRMQKMNRKTFFYELLLLFGTFIWGVAFIFQDMGNQYVDPITFNVERCLVAFVFLFGLYFVFRFVEKRKQKPEDTEADKPHYTFKNWVQGSLVCGIFLALGMVTQQIGISFEGAGKSGFLTALYIVFVPIFGLIGGKKPSLLVWCGIGISVVGLLLINVSESGFSWGQGSWLLLGCAIAYAFQILAVSHFVHQVHPVLLSAGEFFFAFLLQLPFMFIFENPQIGSMVDAWLPVLFCGVASSGIAYTIQIIAQKNIPPTIASIIMSMESVFAILTSVACGFERFSFIEYFGCAVIFCAILVAQLPSRSEKA